MLKKPFFSGRMLFLLMKQKCASPATELLEFFAEKERDFLKKKNTKNLSSDKRSLMFRGAIQSDGRKLLVKCPNKLNAVGYMEILKKIRRKMHFLTIFFFNKIMLLCLLCTNSHYRQFCSRKRVDGTEMTSIQSKPESYQLLMGNFDATITKTGSFLGKFRRKKLWNLENLRRRREKSVWKLYKPSTEL